VLCCAVLSRLYCLTTTLAMSSCTACMWCTATQATCWGMCSQLPCTCVCRHTPLYWFVVGECMPVVYMYQQQQGIDKLQCRATQCVCVCVCTCVPPTNTQVCPRVGASCCCVARMLCGKECMCLPGLALLWILARASCTRVFSVTTFMHFPTLLTNVSGLPQSCMRLKGVTKSEHVACAPPTTSPQLAGNVRCTAGRCIRSFGLKEHRSTAGPLAVILHDSSCPAWLV
jgi:hypothetical protein